MEQQPTQRQLINKLIQNQNRKQSEQLTAAKSKQERLEEFAKNFFGAALIVVIFFSLTMMAFYKHSEEVERQAVVAIKGGV